MLQSLVVIVNVGVVPLSAGGLIWMTISERDTSRLHGLPIQPQKRRQALLFVSL